MRRSVDVSGTSADAVRPPVESLRPRTLFVLRSSRSDRGGRKESGKNRSAVFAFGTERFYVYVFAGEKTAAAWLSPRCSPRISWLAGT